MNTIHNYIIDEQYIFEQNTNSIYKKIDRDQNIELSKPAARLFNEIIILNLKKGIATRDELLTNVWEEYGLVGSNNNLNTYISEIRKKLELLGLDPKSIVTVPKKGFRIDNRISVHESDSVTNNNKNDEEIHYYQEKLDQIENSNSNIPLNEIMAVSERPNIAMISTMEKPFEVTVESFDKKDVELNKTKYYKSIFKNKKINRDFIKFILLAISALAISYIIHIFIYHSSPDKIEKNEYITISSHGKCTIQAPQDMAGKITDENISFVTAKLDKYSISCNKEKRIILLSDLNRTYSFDKNFSISVCKGANSTHDCVSINDQRI